ncbi:acyl-CoA dehydrogenase family protein [Archangium primigenium]|uniref:acyl-CoA dehydrogenase family protein n=1 Tax=[Archangium] primigenium TaxID=2792470 RepID=UPI0019582A94|nr:acyl-CoA dehydrogenase family protein [Archangium primigenium]MBM7117201.1 acyl-CoA dehydrogenase family protein [Archangium primigenium]
MTSLPASLPSPLTADALLAEARRLAPRIAARAEEIEAARRLPADLARELAEAGLFRMVLPESLGGPALHPARVIEVVETLAQADGSTGWCVMIGALTAMCAAWLPEDTGRTMFGAPDAIIGGVAAPTGRAERVEGGYRVTGRWSWASGSQNCRWLTGGVVVTQGGAPRMIREGVPETRLVCFPIEDATLHDTWFASGLCGTGSGDMEVRDIFVPAERTFSMIAERPRVDHPLYAFPAFGLLGVGLPAVALGIARRAVDELTALAQQKKTPLTGRPIAARGAVQEAVAEAEGTLRAARALLMETVNATYAAGERREVTLRHRAELRLSYTHATRSAARVVDRMYEAAGGASVYRASPLQRCFRDIHVATQHAMVAPATLETIGAVLLGVEANTVTL